MQSMYPVQLQYAINVSSTTSVCNQCIQYNFSMQSMYPAQLSMQSMYPGQLQYANNVSCTTSVCINVSINFYTVGTLGGVCDTKLLVICTQMDTQTDRLISV